MRNGKAYCVGVLALFVFVLGVPGPISARQSGGGYTGPGDVVPQSSPFCPNIPCGFPSYPFSNSCNEVASTSIASKLFRPFAQDCFLPVNSTVAYWRYHYAFRRCDLEELKQRIQAGEVIPDSHGNVVLRLQTGELLNTGCGTTTAQYPVWNAQMIELDESGFLDGTMLQGSTYPNCNAPLPVKPYLKVMQAGGASSCYALTGASVSAGNPLLPHGATIVKNPLYQWLSAPPPAPAECSNFELWIEFNLQCMTNIVQQWENLWGPMAAIEPLFVAKILTCIPCATGVPPLRDIDDDHLTPY